MPKNGKRYATAVALMEEEKEYQPAEAMSLVKQTATASFDETVELHLRTGADPRHADQQVRGVTVLPHGIGKQVRVVVFTQGEAMATAEEAGLLEVEPFSVVLRHSRRALCDDKVVEVSRTVYRADRFTLWVQLGLDC